MKCTNCLEEKPSPEMRQCLRSSAYSTWCELCWLSKKRLSSRDKKKTARKRDNAAYKRAYRAWCLKRRYGITIEQVDAMLAAQGMRCAICGSRSSGKKEWAVDHDHASNRVRGVLCHKCNMMIGLSREEPEILLRAAAYLDDRSSKQPLMVTKLSRSLRRVVRDAGKRLPGYSPPDLATVLGAPY